MQGLSLEHANEFSKMSANNVKSIRRTVGEYTKFVNQFVVRGSSTEKQIQKDSVYGFSFFNDCLISRTRNPPWTSTTLVLFSWSFVCQL